jgi:outer membrane protein TolC
MQVATRLALLLLAVAPAGGCASAGGGAGERADGQVERRTLLGPDRAGAATDLPALDERASVDEYVHYALLNNPSLQAAFQRWKAAGERGPQARALDDPELTYEYFIDPTDTRQQVSLTQRIPAFGKRGLMEKAAAAEAQAAWHEFENARLTVFDKVSRAFFEYQFLGRATRVTEEHYQFLGDLERTVRTRYETGAASFSDLVKAQVEKEKAGNEVATMKDERRAMSDKLAAILNVTPTNSLPWPASAPPAAALVDDQVLFGMIEALNPELKAARSMVAKAEIEQALARRSFAPDLMLGANVMEMSGAGDSGDRYRTSVMAGLTLPLWWGRKTARVREAAAQAAAAELDAAGMRNSLRADLRMAIFKLRDGERRIQLFRDSLVPKATQAAEVARQEFATGKADFMSLVDAQRTVLDLKLMYERALVDRELAMTEIGCCIGKYGMPPTEKQGGKDGRAEAP